MVRLARSGSFQPCQAGELLLCEHSPPVFTFGLREREEFEGKAEHLQQLGAQAFKVRGRRMLNNDSLR